MAARRKPAALPSKSEIAEFIRNSEGRAGKREIARAFKVSGADRIALKEILNELVEEGVLQGNRRRFGIKGVLPSVTVIEVTGVDLDGEPLARPTAWESDEPPPRIVIIPSDREGANAPGIGDRALVRLHRVEDGSYEARVMRALTTGADRVLAVLRGEGDSARLIPVDKRAKSDFTVVGNAPGALPGEVVAAEVLRGHRLGLPQARIIQRIGDMDDVRSISLLVVHAHGIPTAFSPETLAAAEAAKAPTLAGRTDLRDIPLVTIDGADARDFDDAVWAEPDDDPDNPGGWHILVAIADVAHYVAPNQAIDRDARERGNSVYFPDRVVPMLPEQLSNGWCSLVPNENRACMAAHIWIDAEGTIRRHRFVRGLMRSAARLTYEQVQAARDGRPDPDVAPLVETVLAPLYGAFKSLNKGREKRGVLDLDVPEEQVVLGEDGEIAEIHPRARLDSHKLIEEFMIAANVAAAETLEAKHAPCMYRIHDQPPADKMESLRQFLDGLDYSLTGSRNIRAGHLNQILKKAEGKPEAPLINTVILRSQSQAAYSPENIGHFGLNLLRYAHFTSPIRRYADLLVHRSLIRALDLGDGGLGESDQRDFEKIAEAISTAERRAASAERDAIERYIARYMVDRVGARFTGRINGVARFGLFVTIDGIGADGLVPRRSLPGDFTHDEARHRLVEERTGAVFALGDAVEVRLMEASPITGGLVFEVLSPPGRTKPGRVSSSRSRPQGKTRTRKGGTPTRNRKKR